VLSVHGRALAWRQPAVGPGARARPQAAGPRDSGRDDHVVLKRCAGCHRFRGGSQARVLVVYVPTLFRGRRYVRRCGSLSARWTPRTNEYQKLFTAASKCAEVQTLIFRTPVSACC